MIGALSSALWFFFFPVLVLSQTCNLAGPWPRLVATIPREDLPREKTNENEVGEGKGANFWAVGREGVREGGGEVREEEGSGEGEVSQERERRGEPV